MNRIKNLIIPTAKAVLLIGIFTVVCCLPSVKAWAAQDLDGFCISDDGDCAMYGDTACTTEATPSTDTTDNNIASITQTGSVPSNYKIPADVLKNMNKNKTAYVEAAKKYKIPWQVIAATHYKEALNDPNKDIQSGEPIPLTYDPGPSVDDAYRIYNLIPLTDMRKSADGAAAEMIDKAKMVGEKLNVPHPTAKAVKEAFYGKNGRAYGSADNSPYVMNGYDASHMHMPLAGGGTDANVGAYVIYVLLGGEGNSGTGSGDSDSGSATTTPVSDTSGGDTDTGTAGADDGSCVCQVGSGGNAASDTKTDGTNSAKNVYDFLTDSKRKLKPVTAAALTGNFIWESGGDQTALTVDPTNVNSIGATGIAQWYAERATALHNFAKGQNKSWDDLSLQLDYLWKELSGSYKPILDDVKAISNIEEATITFEKRFEISGDVGSYPTRIALAKKVLAKWGNSVVPHNSTVGGSSSDSTGCGDSGSGGSGGEAFILGDYAWPVDIPKSELNAGYPMPCQGTCHHDNTPAFDFSSNKAVGGQDNDVVGKAEFAITSGTISNLHIYMGIPGCFSFQLVGNDGWQYYYTHFRNPAVKEGDKVKVGQKVAEVGERKCTGNGSYPHLHIDRGYPKGHYGGVVGNRDMDFVPLINKLYEAMPDSRV